MSSVACPGWTTNRVPVGPGRSITAAARGNHDAADDLQAHAAVIAERDRASPNAFPVAAVAT